METIGFALGAVAFVALIVYNIRRRWRMTPEQRNSEDMLREQRTIRRELQRRG